MAKKTITYSKDIIKNVSIKSGIPEDQVEYVFRFFFRFMRKKMADPTTTEILWPKFGTFYTALPLLKIKQKELHLGVGNAPEKMGWAKEELLTTEKRIADIERRDQKYKDNSWYGHYKSLVHNSFPMLYRNALRKNMTDKQLEEFQNEEHGR
jgi:hypothetical protein